MIKTLAFILLAAVYFLAISCERKTDTQNEKQDIQTKKMDTVFRVIGFYSGNGKDIEKYEIGKLTHIIFCFTNLKGNKISIKNSEDEQTLKHLVTLKAKHPKLKVIVSFGGWGGCRTCSDVFSIESNRKKFALSVKDLLLKYNADGFDLDWESPVIGGYKDHKASEGDKVNFTALIQELRNTLPAKSEICFDANSFKAFLELSIDWKNVMPLIDYVNLMTYSLPGDEVGHTGHHTALFSSPYQNESVDIAIHRLDSIGLPKNKIVIGAAFYAESVENVDSVNNGLGRAGKFKTRIHYSKLIKSFTKKEGYEYHWDTLAQAPFLYNKQLRTFITFDDKKSVTLKTKYAFDKNLGGIMFWNLNKDTYQEGLLDTIDKQVKYHKSQMSAHLSLIR